LKFQAVAEKTAKDAMGYFILPHPVYAYIEWTTIGIRLWLLM